MVAPKAQRTGDAYRNNLLSDTISWQQRDFERRPCLRRHAANCSPSETQSQCTMDGHLSLVAAAFGEWCWRISSQYLEMGQPTPRICLNLTASDQRIKVHVLGASYYASASIFNSQPFPLKLEFWGQRDANEQTHVG